MTEEVLAAVLCGVACGLAGLLVPVVIRAVPQPVSDLSGGAPGDEAEDEAGDEHPRLTFAEVAGSPALAARAATVAAVAGAGVGYALGGTWALLVVVPLVPVGVALAVIDWRTQLLPKYLIVPTYAVVVLACLAAAALTGELEGLLGAGIGWAVIGGVYFTLWFIHPPAMGYGDVRLAGILGIALGYLGYETAFSGLMLGMLLGGVGGGLLTLLRIVDRRNLPFGPFMLVGAWAGVVLGGLLPVS